MSCVDHEYFDGQGCPFCEVNSDGPQPSCGHNEVARIIEVIIEELTRLRAEVERLTLKPHERVCALFCVGCDKPRIECSCGCIMAEWRPVEVER
jgi:hypothetical protein